jgi:triphosphoribosyl-dephospho-CoA synthase
MATDTGFADHCRFALGGVSSVCRPWGRGWCAAMAGILEVTAPKPGNVHPDASFPDLSSVDLVAAAISSAVELEHADRRPVGETIRAAVAAACKTTPSNANLGIMLVMAPLAAVPEPPRTADAVESVLASLDSRDAAAIWEAIALARPGGLGRSDRWDLAGPPPPDIRAAMRQAAARDTIARLWADGYGDLFAGPVADLAETTAAGVPLAEAIVRTHVRQLAREPDSLIARRHGEATAREVTDRARALAHHEDTSAWPGALAAFDGSLRQPRRLNPGTTADLVAGAIYILLREGRLRAALPFATPSDPEFTAS